MGQFPSTMTGFEEKSFSCLPGDKLLFYTDGINEVTNTNNQMLGDKRLFAFIRENSELPIESLLEKIYHFALDFSNDEGFKDDITLIGMELLP